MMLMPACPDQFVVLCFHATYYTVRCEILISKRQTRLLAILGFPLSLFLLSLCPPLFASVASSKLQIPIPIDLGHRLDLLLLVLVHIPPVGSFVGHVERCSAKGYFIAGKELFGTARLDGSVQQTLPALNDSFGVSTALHKVGHSQERLEVAQRRGIITLLNDSIIATRNACCLEDSALLCVQMMIPPSVLLLLVVLLSGGRRDCQEARRVSAQRGATEARGGRQNSNEDYKED
jgi:hypothetical protein